MFIQAFPCEAKPVFDLTLILAFPSNPGNILHLLKDILMCVQTFVAPLEQKIVSYTVNQRIHLGSPSLILLAYETFFRGKLPLVMQLSICCILAPPTQ